MIEAFLGPLQRGLMHAGVLLLVGVAVWSRVLRPAATVMLQAQQALPATFEPFGEISLRVARIGRIATALLVPLWGLRLIVQVLGFRDPFVPLSEDISFLLGETFWGTVWIAQGIVLFLLIPSITPLVRSPRLTNGWLPGMALVAALPVTLALSSHSMSETGIHRFIAVGADGIHAFAAGAWMGSLALILLSRDRGQGQTAVLAAQLRAFSPVVLFAVPMLVGMGATLALYHLSSPQDLWSTPYGRLLSGKILSAGVVLFLGFLNWRRGLPLLDSERGRRSVRRRAVWEVTAASVVLAFTGVLTGTPSP